MRILLTNDDGIFAPGLKVLEAIAKTLSDDVWIVAPSEEQSGASHALTLSRPVRLRRHDDRRFSVSGSPTDSVIMALSEVMETCPPDLILSGVNRGANMGDDVTYSGTVAAAMEGTLAGIRSIALSQVYAREGMGDAVPFAAAEAWGARVITSLLTADLPPRTLVNVNFPALPADAVKGVRVAAQGFHDYGRALTVKGTDPRGYPYYWFGLTHITHVPGHDTDMVAIDDGFVTVTPLQLDLTHRASIPTLQAVFAE